MVSLVYEVLRILVCYRHIYEDLKGVQGYSCLYASHYSTEGRTGISVIWFVEETKQQQTNSQQELEWPIPGKGYEDETVNRQTVKSVLHKLY